MPPPLTRRNRNLCRGRARAAQRARRSYRDRRRRRWAAWPRTADGRSRRARLRAPPGRLRDADQGARRGPAGDVRRGRARRRRDGAAAAAGTVHPERGRNQAGNKISACDGLKQIYLLHCGERGGGDGKCEKSSGVGNE